MGGLYSTSTLIRCIISIFDDWFVALCQGEFVSNKNSFHILLPVYYDNLLTDCSGRTE